MPPPGAISEGVISSSWRQRRLRVVSLSSTARPEESTNVQSDPRNGAARVPNGSSLSSAEPPLAVMSSLTKSGLLRVGCVSRVGRADGGACVVGLEARHGEGQRIPAGGDDQARPLADLLGDVASRGEILGLLLLRGLRARGGSI